MTHAQDFVGLVGLKLAFLTLLQNFNSLSSVQQAASDVVNYMALRQTTKAHRNVL